MTPKGHMEPQDLANEEPQTTGQWLESLWEQATRPWVRLHTTGQGNVLPKVSLSWSGEVSLLAPQVRKPQAKDHKPAKRSGINTTAKENFISSKSSEHGLEWKHTLCVCVCSILFNTIWLEFSMYFYSGCVELFYNMADLWFFTIFILWVTVLLPRLNGNTNEFCAE